MVVPKTGIDNFTWDAVNVCLGERGQVIEVYTRVFWSTV